MRTDLIRLALEVLAKLATGNIIPKGYLTSVSAGLSIVIGLGMLASTILMAIESGEIPDQLTLNDAFALILLTQGGQAAGVARKVEALSVEASADAAPTPPAG